MKTELKLTREPNTGVLEYYEGHAAYSQANRPESEQAVREFNECDCCASKGTLKYYGFRSLRGGSPVDITKCTKCGDENEF